MKKLTLLIVLPLFFNSLYAQSDKDELLLLKKSQASIEFRLNEQNKLLVQQKNTTDSVLSFVVTEGQAIESTEESLGTLSTAESKLELQNASITKAISNISDSFVKRRMFSIIGFICSLIVALAYILFLKKKVSFMNSLISKTQENFNTKIEEMSLSLKVMVDNVSKNVSDINTQMEVQNVQSKDNFSKQSVVFNEQINLVTIEINKNIEAKIESIQEKIDSIPKKTNTKK